MGLPELGSWAQARRAALVVAPVGRVALELTHACRIAVRPCHPFARGSHQVPGVLRCRGLGSSGREVRRGAVCVPWRKQ